VKLRVELRSMIRDLQIEAGITTVFVTHDQEEALAMSDFIAVMDRGRIVQIGSPGEIYTRPRTVFAADFVGSANLIPVTGELAPDADGARRLATPAGVILTTHDAPLRPGSRLAIRSEEVSLIDTGPAADGQVAGTIEHVQFRGSVTGYTVRTAAGAIRVDVWTAQQKRPRARGESVMLGMPRTAQIVEAG
jgi:iron(III) transport system ATP-binding protein